ncbi:MAG: hypothetical protein K2I03_07340 [Lachnospiraceae bacterium]|nr:hypothetical protein [Lachnospiraceae bacterium]
MSKKVLITGRIIEAERCENTLRDGTVVNVVKFKYEFEYDGIRYEERAMDSIGTDCKDIPQVGSTVEIYFYPDIEKCIRRQKRKGSAVTSCRTIFLVVLIMGLIYILLTSYNVKTVPKAAATVLYTVGTVMLLKEILFCIEKKLGRYIKVPATFNGYDISSNSDSGVSYHKTYTLSDTGELYRSPQGVSIKGRMEAGQEVFLYRHINTSAIREEANFAIGSIWFILNGFMGTMFIILM